MGQEKMTKQEMELISLMHRLIAEGKTCDYIALILAVEALAAEQTGIVIEEHHPDIQGASSEELEEAVKVIQSKRQNMEEVSPGTTDIIIKYTQNILEEREGVTHHG